MHGAFSDDQLSGKMHVAWQAQYQRHAHQRYWEVGIGFLREFGVTLSQQVQHFRQMEPKNRKTYWCKAVSLALKFLFLKDVSHKCFVFDDAT